MNAIWNEFFVWEKICNCKGGLLRHIECQALGQPGEEKHVLGKSIRVHVHTLLIRVKGRADLRVWWHREVCSSLAEGGTL